ncbi:OmpA family protein [Sphingomonas sp. PB2P19]|uniref:OmpA family protein n=1 Tax=Sphingomonas rhamnosi TaxID=3096156 RepID=UPI002FCB296F
MTNFIARAALGVAMLAAGATPVFAQARYDMGNPPWARPGYRLAGAGVPVLFPELRNTPRGRAFVMPNFDANGDGRISPQEARDANREFARLAGPRRDRFDWDGYARGRDQGRSGGPRSGDTIVTETTTWDRGAMRDYGFRQTPRGATLTLSEDVLFQTDSAVLRPGAIEKLRPLAAYLRGNPGVRVAIDGFTDSRGSDAHNQDLSERRAASVRQAFDDMDVVRARFTVVGHGEADPVATNATTAGMRLNRRVEVTLLGQRADSFAR